MGSVVFNPSFLFSLFLLTHLACSCPIDSFYCRNAETPSVNCGSHMIRCVNSKPEIQFNGEGKWYRTENITYPEKSLKILDEQLGSELQHGDCDFLYNFTHPLLPFNTSSIGNLLGSPRLPLFNCTASSYDFSRDLFTEEYDASPCTSYDLYFSHRPGQLQFRNANDCHSSEPPVVKWELLFDETGNDGGLSFSLKSVAFSRSRRPSAECFGCVMKGGGCSSVAAPDSSCICHQDCPRGSTVNVKRKILLGVTFPLVAACFSCCFCIFWRKMTFAPVAACFSCCFCIFWRSKSSIAQTVETFLVTHGPLALTRYRYSEVKQMTDSFNVKLGQGGYGSVFRGKLHNGAQVAVKLLNESKGNGEDFINEVASIGRTNHINVVSLVGFCSEGKKRALIYEFMPNGSLEKFIYANDPNATTHLEWEQLFKITLGIARGLEYLHNGCKTRIVHFDIKPHNILLDDDFCPKISDFGLAKLCPPKNSIISSICARGTIGYIAPEVFSRNFGVVSSKSDVYSYGMMVLEMVGVRKNANLRVEQNSEIYFPHWIYEHLEQVGNLQICGITTENEHIAKKLVLVGLWCIQTNPAIRPAINRVVEMLEELVDNLQMPPKPYFCSPLVSETNSNISSSATLIS